MIGQLRAYVKGILRATRQCLAPGAVTGTTKRRPGLVTTRDLDGLRTADRRSQEGLCVGVDSGPVHHLRTDLETASRCASAGPEGAQCFRRRLPGLLLLAAEAEQREQRVETYLGSAKGALH